MIIFTLVFFFFGLMNPALCYIIALIHLHILVTFVVWFDIFIYIFVRAEFKICNGGEFCL